MESEIEIPVQVNGKFRDVIKVAVDADNATIEAAAKASEKVQVFTAGKTIKKVIIVPKKMVNLIAALISLQIGNRHGLRRSVAPRCCVDESFHSFVPVPRDESGCRQRALPPQSMMRSWKTADLIAT